MGRPDHILEPLSSSIPDTSALTFVYRKCLPELAVGLTNTGSQQGRRIKLHQISTVHLYSLMSCVAVFTEKHIWKRPKPISLFYLRSISSNGYGGLGVAEEHHFQQVCTQEPSSSLSLSAYALYIIDIAHAFGKGTV
ncbi:hypothetical protein MUG91_G275n9 [Manis pentadactyla]|nr:hypothetical protein MUG91_G275n9 [Manis pentadactyla]